MNVKGKSTITRVCDILRNDITMGQFKAGDRLSERVLSEKYRASRASIRESIRQLTSEGYLTQTQFKGVIVTRLSMNDIETIYNILIRCESYATRLFSQNPSQIWVARLEKLTDVMHSLEKTFDHRKWHESNDTFHSIIYLHSGSNILSELIHHMRLRIFRLRRMQLTLHNMNLYNRQHAKILSSIRDRQPEKAEQLMRDHLNIAMAKRLTLLTEMQGIF